MEDEREDGEISEAESNPCEDVDVYNPVSRPVSNIFESRQVCSSIPSSDNESSSSDSDSEEECSRKPKRQKTNTKNVQMEIERNRQQQEHSFGKPKRNNIWANVLQEEELLGIGGVGLKKLKSDRNVESYDYTQALKVYENKEDPFEFEETEEDIQKRLQRKRRFCDDVTNKNKKKEKKHNGPRYLADIILDPEWDKEELGNVIADALHEQKPELVVRVVQALGQEKALELYQSTQKVEKEGGILINNGSRRRTSGGVYLLLLKTFDGVTSEHLSSIFCEDQKEEQLWRKRMRANRRRQKYKQKRMESCDSENKKEEDGLHLRGLFSDDPGGTKCPGSTPVTSPTTSDNEENDRSPHLKMKSNQTLLQLKEVCEKAASEIIFRDNAEEGELIEEFPVVRQDDMETC